MTEELRQIRMQHLQLQFRAAKLGVQLEVISKFGIRHMASYYVSVS